MLAKKQQRRSRLIGRTHQKRWSVFDGRWPAHPVYYWPFLAIKNKK
jgi:hypothetical protein